MITDSHVHLLPPRLGRAVRRFFREHIPGPLAYPDDHRLVLAALAAAGITEVWNLPYAHKPGVAASLNEASAHTARAGTTSGLRVVGAATVHPGDEDPAGLVNAAVVRLGLRVLKLHCSVGRFDADDPRLDPVWRVVAARSIPTVVHVGHHVSGETYGEELDALARVAQRFPDAPLIVAHCGHPATARAVELVARHATVHADLTPRVHDPVAVADDVLEAYPDRFLFGSDAPNTGVPVERSLARLSTVSDATRNAILSGNAARLLAAVDASAD